jgi:hypothetical protein
MSLDHDMDSNLGRTYILALPQILLPVHSAERGVYFCARRSVRSFRRSGTHSREPTVETLLQHKPSGDMAEHEALCDKHHLTYREDVRELVIRRHFTVKTAARVDPSSANDAIKSCECAFTPLAEW